MKKYDLVVIGSGPAGEKAAVKAAYFGFKVAVIEREMGYGGAVVHTGTLPSKTLKETALFFSGKNDKGLYGADRDFQDEANLESFMYRQKLVSEQSNREVLDNFKRHNVDIFKGVASFESEHVVDVGGKKLFGDKILIATGSYPFQPSEIPFDRDRIHDSDSILEIKKIPSSLCIVGAGVIGCEYATIFATMGTKVHLVNSRDEILGFLDKEIADKLSSLMVKDGIETHFGESIKHVKAPLTPEDNVCVELQSGDVLEVDMFLYAAGRSGRTKDLNCSNAGVEIGKREVIVVNEHYQTSVPHIYAAGDVIGFPALASTSMDQGRVAVSHMFGTKDLDSLPKVFCYGIYTIPEVSTVGMTEETAIAQKISYFVGRASYNKMPRGRIMGTQDGMMKMIFDRNDMTILGVHLIGPLAAELVHYGMSLVEDKKNIHQVLASVFNFPTLHELYKYACYDALGNLSGHKLKEH